MAYKTGANSHANTFVYSRLDYCNAILAGLPKSTIAPLQRTEDAAARLIVHFAANGYVTISIL